MNWEAVAAIGGVALALAVVLLVPGLLWARRKSRENPAVAAGMAVTRSGFVLAGIMVLVLLAGFSAEYWATGTEFGRWMSTGFGRLAFTIATVGVTVGIESTLRIAGIYMLRKRK